MARRLAAALLLAGCVPAPTDAFLPYAFTVRGLFAWDDEALEARSYVSGAAEVGPTIEVSIYDRDYYAGDDAASCRVALTADGARAATRFTDEETWRDADGAEAAFAHDHTGFVIGSGDVASIDADCDETLVSAVRGFDWGVGVGPVRDDVAALLDASFDDADLRARMRGGVVRWSGLDPSGFGAAGHDFALAYEVDAEFTITLDADDAPKLLEAAAASRQPLARAAWVVSPAYGFPGEFLLPE